MGGENPVVTSQRLVHVFHCRWPVAVDCDCDPLRDLTILLTKLLFVWLVVNRGFGNKSSAELKCGGVQLRFVWFVR